MADSTVADINKMKVVDLRKELKSRGLSHTGDKAELVSRLQAAMSQDDQGDITLDSDEIDSDGVLEDEDDKSQNDIALDDPAVELALADAPTKETDTKLQKSLKRKHSIPSDCAATKNEQKEGSKKIVLNRATSVTTLTQTKLTESTEIKESVKTAVGDGTKVRITADLDPKTRLEMRAKRFGLPVQVPDSARKEARKLRFGQTTATVSGNTSSTLAENLEKLKKRAERFGQSVSKIMTDIEKKERLEKRKEKFGKTN